MARLLILHTGGTFGMRSTEGRVELDPRSDPATPLERIPQLEELGTIEHRFVCNRDSSDVSRRSMAKTRWSVRNAAGR